MTISISSTLSSTQKYAAGALLALALRQAQIHQTHPPASSSLNDVTNAVADDDDDPTNDVEFHVNSSWTHESQFLLRPVFKFLEIDKNAWRGLEETAASSKVKHHLGGYMKLFLEDESEELLPESSELAVALVKSVSTMSKSLQRENEEDEGEEVAELSGNVSIQYQKKLMLLFELLSACVADITQENNSKEFKIRRKGYDARHRTALRLLAAWLNVDWTQMEAMEILVACSAMAAEKEKLQSQKNESNKSKWSKWKRGGIIGAAALTGGAILAITGGLAAPAIAAGFGALAPTLGTLVPIIGAGGFAAVASAAGSVAGSVAVAASFGAAGAGLSGTKMARRTGSIKEFEFKPVGDNHNQGCLAVGILVSGFVFDEKDFTTPWKGCEDNLEKYAIQWESKYLIAVSTAIQDWITSSLTLGLMKQGAMMTVLSSLVTALAWPAVLLAATDWIDSKWSMAVDRSDKAGKLLAEVLIKGLQGNRPVTLFGFSLGARVIFKCLQHLAESGGNVGLVERVVLLGAPISVKGEKWESVRKMVSGRFVNTYSTNDWILGVTFRASLLTKGLAGIQKVDDVPGIENVDVSHMIDGHSSYLPFVQKIIAQLEIDTYYPVFNSDPNIISE